MLWRGRAGSASSLWRMDVGRVVSVLCEVGFRKEGVCGSMCMTVYGVQVCTLFVRAGKESFDRIPGVMSGCV